MKKKDKRPNFTKLPLPEKVRIGVAEYTILHDRAKRIMQKDSDGDYPMGEYKAKQTTIAVDSEMSPIRQMETFVHETVHMILYETGLYKDAFDHEKVNPISIVLTRMLLENDFGWMHKWYKEQMGHEREDTTQTTATPQENSQERGKVIKLG